MRERITVSRSVVVRDALQCLEELMVEGNEADGVAMVEELHKRRGMVGLWRIRCAALRLSRLANAALYDDEYRPEVTKRAMMIA